MLCAPTGRAAKRMTEASGFEAKTILVDYQQVTTERIVLATLKAAASRWSMSC
jgi:hypothetical protein